MPKHGKNYRNKVQVIDRTILHELEKGVELVVGSSYAKFDETFDIAMKLGCSLTPGVGEMLSLTTIRITL